MDDITTLWVKKVLDHQDISDAFKLRFFEELFGEELDEENVEHQFKIWRNNSIKSSNVKKIKYNDESGELVVQFNDKSIYTYYNIPFDIYRRISTGDYAPVTTGSNEYGSWEKGKKPSVGAGIHQALINTGVQYKKGGTLK
jgi:hypothetical protein